MAGVTADHVLETVEVVIEELHKISAEAVSDEELDRVRQHTVGSFRLSLDAAASWCHRAGGMLIANGTIEPVDETIAGYEAVTATDIQRAAQRIVREGNLAAAVVGPFEGCGWSARACRRLQSKLTRETWIAAMDNVPRPTRSASRHTAPGSGERRIRRRAHPRPPTGRE